MEPVYLDCNATTPMEPSVQDEVLRCFREEFANSGSRTHRYGQRAKSAVEGARYQVARLVAAQRDEVIFTSGATESNNLAILGLLEEGHRTRRKHILSTAIEHKAVLEPLDECVRRGFDVTLLPPMDGGWVSAQAVSEAVRPDTLLVSVMHVNNETGILQPISEIAQRLAGTGAFLHVDAAQGFGKEVEALTDPRVDLISISGHKIYGPKGVGALVARRRNFDRPPLTPLTYGGGQERGLRPGTLPVPLIVGLGLAAEIAGQNADARRESCLRYRERILFALAPLNPFFNGDQERCIPHTLNLGFDGVDSEALMLVLKDLIAISNGSACTASNYTPSHVLQAMGLPDDRVSSSVRISWSHLTPEVEWEEVVRRLRTLL